jgi:hypothetical protein
MEKIRAGRTLQRREEIRGRMLAMGRPGPPDLARSSRSERLATRGGEGKIRENSPETSYVPAGGVCR